MLVKIFSLNIKSKLAQSLLVHTHKPLKFGQVSLHKTLMNFQNDYRWRSRLNESKLWVVNWKHHFENPAWEHSVVHSEPGFVELEQLEISIKVFKGRFIEAI